MIEDYERYLVEKAGQLAWELTESTHGVEFGVYINHKGQIFMSEDKCNALFEVRNYNDLKRYEKATLEDIG
jgi:hypothetical protein